MTLKELKTLSNQNLDHRIRKYVRTECEITADIIEMIREAERRRLYLEYNCTSLFQYLTNEVGYANGSAQRRIDAARLYEEVPTLKDDIASGVLNLTHVSIVAQTVRQKEREAPKFQLEVTQARELLEKIKGHDSSSSQRIVAQELEIEIKGKERVRVQSDGSLRIEITLSKKQLEKHQRVREVISHTHPNPNWAEVFEHLADYHLKREDPLQFEDKRRKRAEAKSRPSVIESAEPTHEESTGDEAEKPITDAAAEVASEMAVLSGTAARTAWTVESANEVSSGSATENETETEIGIESGAGAALGSQSGELPKPSLTYQLRRQPKSTVVPIPRAAGLPALRKRRYISVHTERFVHRRDETCRWCDPKTGETCGSWFQLEVDHIVPLWAGGSNDPENLQLLCDVHNRLKYRQERKGRVD